MKQNASNPSIMRGPNVLQENIRWQKWYIEEKILILLHHSDMKTIHSLYAPIFSVFCQYINGIIWFINLDLLKIQGYYRLYIKPKIVSSIMNHELTKITSMHFHLCKAQISITVFGSSYLGTINLDKDSFMNHKLVDLFAKITSIYCYFFKTHISITVSNYWL